MPHPVKQAKILDWNALYYGYPVAKLMERAGRGIAEKLREKYGAGKRIAFFCGPGNNGGDGFVAARYLLRSSRPEIYLVPPQSKLKTEEARRNWDRFKGKKQDNVSAGRIRGNFDIIVDCLFGTGLDGNLRQPYFSVVKKLNELRGKKVAIDLPTPGFRADYFISMMFPKVPGAAVVDIGYPAELKNKIGIGEVKILHKPKPGSHKGDNGRILILAGSKKYHGALLLAVKTAAKVVDLVYVASVPENEFLINKLKSGSAEFITVTDDELEEVSGRVDAVLIGPGAGTGEQTRSKIDCLLKKHNDKKFILDADALKTVDRKRLGKHCLLTPHKQEFKNLFGLGATRVNARKMAEKYGCTIALKGKNDIVCDSSDCKENFTGNPGMTKGGTGDVLAGLITALAAKNELFPAACAGVFINGLAGDRLKEKASYYFSASDLVAQIPRTINWCLRYPD